MMTTIHDLVAPRRASGSYVHTMYMSLCIRCTCRMVLCHVSRHSVPAQPTLPETAVHNATEKVSG